MKVTSSGRRNTCKGLFSLGIAGCGSGGSSVPVADDSGETTQAPSEPIEIEPLPAPRLEGAASLEAVLAERRSVRSFTEEPLTMAEIGQLMWAAQGVTDTDGGRTAPSAGALYPLEMYVLTAQGVHHYFPADHELALVSTDDVRAAVPAQDFVGRAPAIFVVAAVYARTAERYGDRAERFALLEAGHATQNLLLQAVAMQLGATPVGAFDADELARLMELPGDHDPVYVIPVGHP